jgi:hypothetical protein
MADPELVEYYTRALRGGFSRAFGNRIGDAHETAMLESLLSSADRLAEQLEHSILDAPWLRAETLKLVDEWINQPGDVLNLADLRDALTPMFGVPRAMLIARTETANTFNGAFAAGLRAHGWRRIRWIAASDACEECAALDGEEMSIEEYEANATQHPNCSCSCEPAGEDEETDDIDQEEEAEA